MNNLFKTACLLLTATSMATAQPAPVVRVNVAQPVADIQPTMWGVFFEDINFGADGGIYAEMVKNRSFEFYRPLMGWTVQGKKHSEGDILIENRQSGSASEGMAPVKETRNPRFLRVTTNNTSKGDLGLTNEGFRGMGIKKGLRYDFSVMYRTQWGNAKLHIELLNARDEPIGQTILPLAKSDNGWQKQAVSFNATATEPKGKLNVWFGERA